MAYAEIFTIGSAQDSVWIMLGKKNHVVRDRQTT